MRDGNKRVGKTAYSAGSAILVIVIAVLVNVLISGTTFRWDTTEDNLYSLSSGTQTILSELKEDVVIKVFYSSHLTDMPSHIKMFAQRVLDFLGEYEQYGKGWIKVETYDPKPDSEEEEWAIKYGVKSIRMPSGDPLYLGLVVLSADKEAAMEFIDPAQETRLEYDITRLITQVETSDKMKIAVVSSLPVFGTPPMNRGMGQPPSQSEPWFFIDELKKTYDLTNVNINGDHIDPGTDLLILFHPKNMSEQLTFAVDQYILGGGNVIVFADPLSLMDDPRMGQGGSIPEKLFSAWGIKMEKGKAVADYSIATQLRNREGQVETNPLWLSPRAQSFSKEALITADLDSMLFAVAGSIEVVPDSGYHVVPLIQSSTNNAMVDAFVHGMDVQTLRRDFAPSGIKRNLAVRITGKFKTAFPDGKPQKANGDDESETKQEEAGQAPPLTEGTSESIIVVVADSDMLFDGYYVNKQNLLGFSIANVFNDNLNFVLNSSEMLTGNPALIRVRSRGTFERPFTRVQALERKAQDRWLSQEQELVRKGGRDKRKTENARAEKGYLPTCDFK